MHSLVFQLFSIVSILAGVVLALPYAQDDVHAIRSPTTKAARSADTCADPSLAQIVYQAFNGPQTSHILAYFATLETVNSLNKEQLWGDIHPAFKAWPGQQNFTSPFWQLETPSQSQFTYQLGANAASPPIVSGFTSNEAVIAWAYSSQVCGSVPLMSAVLTSTTDSFYTIDPFVHAGLIGSGWTDTGVVAFVLPLYNSDS